MNGWFYFVLNKGMLNETYFVEISVLLYYKLPYTLLLFLQSCLMLTDNKKNEHQQTYV